MPFLTPAEAIQRPTLESTRSRITREIATEWGAYDLTYGRTIDVSRVPADVLSTLLGEMLAAGWEVTALDDAICMRPMP